MDLQLKLVNDGYAKKINQIDHPNWAKWRQSLFAFTIEPAAIVLNKKAFKNIAIPKTRQDLIKELDQDQLFLEIKLEHMMLENLALDTFLLLKMHVHQKLSGD